MRTFTLILVTLCSASWAEAPAPVIDMHLHALDFEHQGPPPLAMCTPMQMPYWDQQEAYGATFMSAYRKPHCDNPVWSPMSNEELLQRTLAMLEEHNVYGVLSGTREKVDAWMLAAPGRFLPGLSFRVSDDMPSPEALVEWHDAGFGKRVMFGSDQMVWPETIERSIHVINEAPFLSDEERRDILFWNAARFLRLTDAEIERMHGNSS